MYLDLKEKTLKRIKMTPKYSPILWSQINIHKIIMPHKIFIFLKTPQNIEIQNFEPKNKMTRAYVCMKIWEYPHPPGLQMSQSKFRFRWKAIWIVAIKLNSFIINIKILSFK